VAEDKGVDFRQIDGPRYLQGPQSNAGGGAYAAYRPGQAQSQQSPYATATPYGQASGGAQGFAAYAPQTRNYGMSPQQQQQAATAWTMPKVDLMRWANNQPQQQNLYSPQSGPDPSSVWGRNAAIVQQINDTQANQQVGTYLGEGAPPAGWGQTNYNPQQMISTANQMTQKGWENPFARAPANQGGGQFADIFRQFGVQAPPGLMDALLGRLQGQSAPPQVTPPTSTINVPGRGTVAVPRGVTPERLMAEFGMPPSQPQRPAPGAQEPGSTQTPGGLYDQYQQERRGQEVQQGRDQAMRELHFLTGQRQTPTVQSDFSADQLRRWMEQQRQDSKWEYDNQSKYYPDKVGASGLTNRLFDFLDRAPAATGNATVDTRQREGFARQAGDALQQAAAAGIIGQQEAAAIGRWYATGGQEGESPADARRRLEYSQWLESRGMSPSEAAEAARGQYAVPEVAAGGPANGGYLDWHIRQGQQAMAQREMYQRPALPAPPRNPSSGRPPAAPQSAKPKETPSQKYERLRNSQYREVRPGVWTGPTMTQQLHGKVNPAVQKAYEDHKKYAWDNALKRGS
jgi:hypothetical protein